jgi:hypothetical protein
MSSASATIGIVAVAICAAFAAMARMAASTRGADGSARECRLF